MTRVWAAPPVVMVPMMVFLDPGAIDAAGSR